jgi:hypothetical protein
LFLGAGAGAGAVTAAGGSSARATDDASAALTVAHAARYAKPGRFALSRLVCSPLIVTAVAS